MSDLLHSNSKMARRLADALGLPDRISQFTLTIAAGSFAKVTVTFAPTEEQIAKLLDPLTIEYELVQRAAPPQQQQQKE